MVDSISEIVECHTVCGECDFILKIICRDMLKPSTIN
ncbi:Lrp/AsnC ligand binding domain-containing protein [Psychromonas sp.]